MLYIPFGWKTQFQSELSDRDPLDVVEVGKALKSARAHTHTHTHAHTHTRTHTHTHTHTDTNASTISGFRDQFVNKFKKIG
jgi:ABC-type nickel/cobalt efflux system permease component RcnA